MRCTLVLEFDSAKGEQPRRVEVLHLHRNTEVPVEGDVGLTLAEAKTVLLSVQQDFVDEQLYRYCTARRACHRCGAIRKLHDSHCSEVCTVISRVDGVRERWKACSCGADSQCYVSPLKNYLCETYTAELKWLHAKLGALLPYRQALEVLSLLLPSSGRDSHVTVRNHTIAIGRVVRSSSLPIKDADTRGPIAELGIDVGYVRKTKPRRTRRDGRRETGAISIVVAAVGPRGKRPRVWASARPRDSTLRAEMTRFLASSGYGEQAKVQVITDAARDLADVSGKLLTTAAGCWTGRTSAGSYGWSTSPSRRWPMVASPRTDQHSSSGTSLCGFAAMCGPAKPANGRRQGRSCTGCWTCGRKSTHKAWRCKPA